MAWPECSGIPANDCAHSSSNGDRHCSLEHQCRCWCLLLLLQSRRSTSGGVDTPQDVSYHAGNIMKRLAAIVFLVATVQTPPASVAGIVLKMGTTEALADTPVELSAASGGTTRFT